MISIGDPVRYLLVAAVAVGLSYAPACADSPPPAKKSSTKSSTASKPSGKPTIMDFGASWCVPCKEFAPTFAKVKAQYGSKADFQSIDAETEDGEKVALKYGVTGFPTVIITDAKGKTVWRKSGKIDEKVFTAEVTKAVGK